MTAPELRIFDGIARAWSLSADERRALLGDGAADTQHERLALVAQCYEAAHLLLPIANRADTWFRRQNAAFGGERAIDVMIGSPDGLGRVTRYLLGETV